MINLFVALCCIVKSTINLIKHVIKDTQGCHSVINMMFGFGELEYINKDV